MVLEMVDGRKYKVVYKIMRKGEIKKIMVSFGDNDFITVWDWIGNVTLMTIGNQNITGNEMLDSSEDIENFIISLIPTGIEFAQYRAGSEFRYRDIDKDELIRLTDYLKPVRFKYNFDELTNEDWLYDGSETLIIDLENNKSYIR